MARRRSKTGTAAGGGAPAAPVSSPSRRGLTDRAWKVGRVFPCAYRYSGARLTKSIAGLRVSDRSIQALWYVGAGCAELRPETVPEPSPAEVRVRALF